METIVVALVGGSGAGKTYFIDSLKQRFDDDVVCRISMDDYYRSRDSIEPDRNGYRNFDEPEAVDIDAFATDVYRLLAGEVISRREYLYNKQTEAGQVSVWKPSPVLLLEGLFIGQLPSELRERIDLTIFVEAPDELRWLRRLQRDTTERNYDEEEIRYRYEQHVEPAFDRYVKAMRSSADIIAVNNDSCKRALRIVAGYLHARLKGLVD